MANNLGIERGKRGKLRGATKIQKLSWGSLGKLRVMGIKAMTIVDLFRPVLGNRYIRSLLWPLEIKVRHKIYHPRTVMLALTYACQCRCVHCSMAIYGKQKELTTEEMRRLMDQFPALGISNVYFFGGEPLLRKDVFELISYSKQNGLSTQLDTNGYLLTKEMVRQLKEAGMDMIGVSLDSANPETHNKLRKLENSFENAVRGIVNCVDEGIKCYISTYASKENLKNGDLNRILYLGKKLGVAYIRILPTILTGKLLKSPEKRLDWHQQRQLRALGDGGFVRLGCHVGDHFYCCSLNKELVFVSCYGDVQPCCHIPFSFGNVKDEPLKQIIDRMWVHPMFREDYGSYPMNDERFRNEYMKKMESAAQFPVNLG